ncbi:hypothetical protein [Alloprevotella sp. OH1205_COT-284]|uniref:hypothetical protein n=1 Tax=Alloprevotella sp. OH1205_COT-284 TaxID=2491043 RepID=UPI0013153121|nr:hypothetical protein [Alloprevotella sp. OH1205_COT-284]
MKTTRLFFFFLPFNRPSPSTDAPTSRNGGKSGRLRTARCKHGTGSRQNYITSRIF